MEIGKSSSRNMKIRKGGTDHVRGFRVNKKKKITTFNQVYPVHDPSYRCPPRQLQCPDVVVKLTRRSVIRTKEEEEQEDEEVEAR